MHLGLPHPLPHPMCAPRLRLTHPLGLPTLGGTSCEVSLNIASGLATPPECGSCVSSAGGVARGASSAGSTMVGRVGWFVQPSVRLKGAASSKFTQVTRGGGGGGGGGW